MRCILIKLSAKVLKRFTIFLWILFSVFVPLQMVGASESKGQDSKIETYSGHLPIFFVVPSESGSLKYFVLRSRVEELRLGRVVCPTELSLMSKPLDSFKSNEYQPVDEVAFKKVLLETIDRAKGRKLICFIHGYNNPKFTATRPAAELLEGGFGQPVLVFDWPSFGIPTHYFADRDRADQLVPTLADFIDKLAKDSEESNFGVTLIAHSMGCRMLCSSLQYRLDHKSYLSLKDSFPTSFEKVIYVSPDLRQTDFTFCDLAIESASKESSLYSSSEDLALKASTLVNRDLFTSDSRAFRGSISCRKVCFTSFANGLTKHSPDYRILSDLENRQKFEEPNLLLFDEGRFLRVIEKSKILRDLKLKEPPLTLHIIEGEYKPLVFIDPPQEIKKSGTLIFQFSGNNRRLPNLVSANIPKGRFCSASINTIPEYSFLNWKKAPDILAEFHPDKEVALSESKPASEKEEEEDWDSPWADVRQSVYKESISRPQRADLRLVDFLPKDRAIRLGMTLDEFQKIDFRLYKHYPKFKVAYSNKDPELSGVLPESLSSKLVRCRVLCEVNKVITAGFYHNADFDFVWDGENYRLFHYAERGTCYRYPFLPNVAITLGRPTHKVEEPPHTNSIGILFEPVKFLWEDQDVVAVYNNNYSGKGLYLFEQTDKALAKNCPEFSRLEF